MHLPKGYTAHYRKKLPPKHQNDAKHQERAQQTPKRVRQRRGILPIHQPQTGTGRIPDYIAWQYNPATTVIASGTQCSSAVIARNAAISPPQSSSNPPSLRAKRSVARQPVASPTVVPIIIIARRNDAAISPLNGIHPSFLSPL